MILHPELARGKISLEHPLGERRARLAPVRKTEERYLMMVM